MQQCLEADIPKPWPVLIYNKDRSFRVHMKPNAELLELLGDAPKQFWLVELKEGEIVRFVRRAKWQEW